VKIGIDLSAAVHRRAGLGRMAQELTGALLEIEPEIEITGFYNDAANAHLDPPLDRLHHQTSSLGNKPWRLAVLLAHLLHRPQERLIGTVDLFHATDHLLPYLPQTATLFSLADLTFISHPQSHTLLNRSYLRLALPAFLRRATAVVTISENSRRDVVSRYPFVAGKCHVIYLGVHDRFQPVRDEMRRQQVRARYSLPERFFLYVGAIEPRKNLPLLLRDFRRVGLPGVRLVLAGRAGWKRQATTRLAAELGLEEQLVFTGYVADEELPVLYSLAEAFVYPSLYEGFGLPVLEAMACGAPVICSATSSLPEVAGDAAILVNPQDEHDVATALQRLAGDQALRGELRAKGLARVAAFSWEKTARETLLLYRELVA
jgi:glycosyltransferase involved in cell wall biosynthesis